MINYLEGEGGFSKFANDPDEAKADLAQNIVHNLKAWRQLYGDFIFPIQTTATFTREAKVTDPKPQDFLKQAIAEYKRGTRTPELVTAYWQNRFIVDGRRVGLRIEVPPCDWTEDEIKRPMLDISGKEVPGMMVPELDAITLPILGRMYPRLGSRTVQEDSPVTETHTTRGWLKVYDSVDAPNRNSRRSDVERFAAEHGYLPGREKSYILSDLLMADTRGKHVDSGSTWSWLLGARVRDEGVHASVDSNGYLVADWYLDDPGIPGRRSGFRLEEARKA